MKGISCTRRLLALASFSAAPLMAIAGGVPTGTEELEEVLVRGRLDQLMGEPTAASSGVVTAEQLERRPILRTGEVLEVVPGLIVTQHSGSGKANQYFLRGFNLDHGTDLSTSVDGVPVNMSTHAHGQGYTDMAFVIPELVESIAYRKGTYHADAGNFSAAGSVDLRYRTQLEAPMLDLEGGLDGFLRALFAGSTGLGNGNLLFAGEHNVSDGPWDLAEDLKRTNLVARYSGNAGDLDYSVTAQLYDGSWRSTDQIPERAVLSGQIDRFGHVDPTDGGESQRYSLGADLRGRSDHGHWRAMVYAIDYHLDLLSNFTYAMNEEDGDQFEQFDDRRVYGAKAMWSTARELADIRHEVTLGADWRQDDIGKVGLYTTTGGVRTGTVREDAVTQDSYSAYASLLSHWLPGLRTELGLRADRFDFSVRSNIAANSGSSNDSIVSPKLSVILGPWSETEFFINVGQGFHSNDARGTTITVDPSDGVTPVDQVDPLVRATGADIGMRTAVVPHVQLNMSVWTLKIASELLFVGDAGLTEASRGSRRSGVELGGIWNPMSWLIVDADLAFSHARFTDEDPAGDHVPGAVSGVASVGVAVEHPSGWFGGLRLRHFGSAPLIEDDSVRSDPTTVFNVDAGYQFSKRLSVSASVFNLFDSRDNDITYYYESRLPGEAAPVNDIHFHPVEPRTLRVTARLKF